MTTKCNAPTEWIDRVLDVLAERGEVRGELRQSHRSGWVSALHVLTELVLDETISEVQTGSPRHTEYHYVSSTIIYLEELGFVRVSRAHGVKSSRANNVEKIEVIL